MELREALAQIADIRIRMAEAESFRGYRSAPIAISGLLAIVTAIAQPMLIPEPTQNVLTFCVMWFGVAGLNMLVAGLAMALRDHFGGTSRTREVTWFALSQLAPSLVAGGLVTTVIVRCVPEAAALLPGLWQVLFSLGLFASCRLLPRAIALVAFFYLISGVVVMAVCHGEWALNPWAMGLPFALGEFAAAFILFWNLERNHEEH